MKKTDFEYAKAVKELEEIAAKVEDPHTSIEDIEKYVARSAKLVEACREYLRSAKARLDAIEQEVGEAD